MRTELEMRRIAKAIESEIRRLGYLANRRNPDGVRVSIGNEYMQIPNGWVFIYCDVTSGYARGENAVRALSVIKKGVRMSYCDLLCPIIKPFYPVKEANLEERFIKSDKPGIDSIKIVSFETNFGRRFYAGKHAPQDINDVSNMVVNQHALRILGKKTEEEAISHYLSF